ncbi:hypothetical protein M8494_03670 [Serratia ureilytica]
MGASRTNPLFFAGDLRRWHRAAVVSVDLSGQKPFSRPCARRYRRFVSVLLYLLCIMVWALLFCFGLVAWFMAKPRSGSNDIGLPGAGRSVLCLLGAQQLLPRPGGALAFLFSVPSHLLSAVAAEQAAHWAGGDAALLTQLHRLVRGRFGRRQPPLTWLMPPPLLCTPRRSANAAALPGQLGRDIADVGVLLLFPPAVGRPATGEILVVAGQAISVTALNNIQ